MARRDKRQVVNAGRRHPSAASGTITPESAARADERLE
jgi:hypothetical protein